LITPWYWIVHTLGVDFGVHYGSWVWYNFWSGFGSDLQEFAIIGLAYGAFHKMNCHSPGCPWVGKYPAVEGNGWHYCKKHHKNGGIHL